MNINFDINNNIEVYVSSNISNDVITLSQDDYERNILIEQSYKYMNYNGATIFPYKQRKKPIILLNEADYGGECVHTRTAIHEYIHGIHYIEYIKNENIDTDVYFQNNPLWNEMVVYTEFFATYLAIYLELKMIKENFEYNQDMEYAESYYLSGKDFTLMHCTESTISPYNCAGYLGGLYSFYQITKVKRSVDDDVLRIYPYSQRLYQVLTGLDKLSVTNIQLQIIKNTLQL